MTPALLSDYFPLQLESDHTSQNREEKYITSGVTWQAYESLLSALGNSSSYRVAYLSDTLEFMSPSRCHDLDKKSIA